MLLLAKASSLLISVLLAVGLSQGRVEASEDKAAPSPAAATAPQPAPSSSIISSNGVRVIRYGRTSRVHGIR
jgi:hypothetical protein